MYNDVDFKGNPLEKEIVKRGWTKLKIRVKITGTDALTENYHSWKEM